MDKDDDVSSDSVSNVSFEIEPKRSPASRKFYFPITDIGRQVKPAAFIFCLLSLLMLASGLVLIGGSIWIILSRSRLIMVIHQPIFDLNDISIFGGLLSIPCFFITCMAHDNRRNFVLLPFLISCLIVSIIMLVVGSTTAIMQRHHLIKGFAINKIQSYTNNGGSFQTVLKYKMLSTMESYTSSTTIKLTWDFIQTSLSCCGVTKPDDWREHEQKFPQSCYQHVCILFGFLGFFVSYYKRFKFKVNFHLVKEVLHANGCLELVAIKLAEQIDMSAGLALIALTVQVVSILLVSHAYYYNRKLVNTPSSSSV